MPARTVNTVVSALEQALLVVDREHAIVFANRAAATLTGIPEHQLCGLRLHLLVVERDRAALEVALTANGIAAPLPLSLAACDREVRVTLRASMIGRDDWIHTLISLDEIAPSASRSFRELAESLPQMIWTSDPVGACDYLSPQWVAYTGIAADRQLGDRWLERLHPDDRERTRQHWLTALHTGTFDTEFRIRRFDGTYRWFKTRAVQLRDAHGKVTQWIGSNTDIQELRDAQDALALSNQELDAHVQTRTRALRDAHLSLEVAAKQLTAAQAVTKIGCWQYQPDDGSVIWSDELFRIFRMPCHERAPRFEDQQRLYTYDSWCSLRAAVDRAVTTGQSYELKLQIVRADGSVAHAVARGETLQEDGGKVARIVGTLQDTTDQEAATHQLLRLTERLQLASSAARMAVWEWNIGDDILIWDDAMKELYGHGGGSHEAWRSSLHPDDAERADAELQAAALTGGEFRSVFRICRPDGDIRYVRAEAKRFLDATSPSPRRMIGINVDVTREHSAELALRRSETLQRVILTHAGAAIVATDALGLVTLFNPGAEQLTGYSAREVVGRDTPVRWHDANELEPGPAMPFDRLVQRARMQGHDSREWTYVRKDGARVPVLLTMTPLHDETGALLGYLGIALDLSARKRSEVELMELNHLLAERSAQREVLLQEVHHRVKNSLQIIASLVNMQRRRVQDGKAQAALTDCHGRIQAIALIHELLYVGKDYSSLPFDAYATLIIDAVVNAIGTRSVRIKHEIAPISLAVDQAVPLGLILNELVTNCLKHAFSDGAPGCITLRLAERPSELELCVEDDGVGVPESLDPATSPSLGMRLVTSLAGQLGGHLVIEPRPTRFRVSIPRAASASP